MKDMIYKIVNDLEPGLIDFCQRLIQTPSMSGDEGAMAELCMNELRKLGYDEVFRDDWGNVVGMVHGAEEGPVIMYNGHMDVVPPGDAADWGKYDPYGGEIDQCMVYDWKLEKEEFTRAIHGRGAGDMKCGLAAMIYTGAALVKLRENGHHWKGTYLMASVVLEENGEAFGTMKLNEETLAKRGIEVDGMVCGEPSSLRLMLGHRGRAQIEVTVTGRSCHGSSPWLGINAVEKGAKLITAVEERIGRKRIDDPHLGKSGIALTMITCEPCALGIVPDKCHITYDRRLVTGETIAGAVQQIQDIIDELSRSDPEFEATVRLSQNERRSYTGLFAMVDSQKPLWIIDEEHPFIRACADGLRSVGEEVHFDYWSFSTDVPALSSKNKPAVGYSGMQEYYIHNPNEKSRLDYLKRSFAGNIAMFLKITELSKDSFFAM